MLFYEQQTRLRMKLYNKPKLVQETTHVAINNV